ncbi:hypothetical protein IV203_013905 [Nitzschia inconspicua]|uniref:Uncharacterized protein n=1 Tax=Nitzschia inconspicua TaxID=303405 RepID=A0A9K3M6S4_9STRA|nr:hypothetical protein IV203_013905 [Nitzschia inconspicua]
MSECTTRRLSNVDVNAASQQDGSPASKRPKIVDDCRPTTTDAQEVSTTTASASASPSLASQSVFTFSLGKSPKKFQVLSCHNLEDLVDIAFQACDPSDGETSTDHIWTIQVGRKTYESGEYLFLPPESDRRASNAKLGDLSLKPMMALHLHYDFGRNLRLPLNVESIDDAQALLDETETSALSISDFPRVIPMPPPPPITFSTDKIDLSKSFSNLDRILKRKNVNFNLFQVGKKRIHGFIKKDPTFGALKLVLLPDKPVCLFHLLKCMDFGVGIKSSGGYNWHSVVILPSNKLVGKYGKEAEPGFCDCNVVLHDPLLEEKLEGIFPKISALAGFTKDKSVPRGWITYEDDVLRVVQGQGSHLGYKAPKNCAYEGDGVHKPATGDKILLKIDKKMESLQELFCRVEGFLETL